MLKCVEITLTDDTACTNSSKTNKGSVTGSQYFVARRGSVATILLSYPEFRIHVTIQTGSDEKQSTKVLLKNEFKLSFDGRL